MSEKIKINVYKGLPIILEKVKGVALAGIIGKSLPWITNKLRHYIVNAKPAEFNASDVELLNKGLTTMGVEIQRRIIEYHENREVVNVQIRELAKLVRMPYIYTECMKTHKQWFESRLAKRSAEGKACSFKEDDVLRINMGVMQVANELKSIELTLE